MFEVCLGPDAWIDILEIHDAPSLRSLVFKTPMFMWDYPPSSFEIRTIGGSLTKLRLDNVHMDDAFSNMIKSNFPFLEELTLAIKSSSGEILDITSLTLRRLMLIFSPDEEIKSWYLMGRLGAYNSSNLQWPFILQLANTSMEYNPLYDADKGFNVMPSSFHDVGDVEFQDNWGRVWVDIGTSDYFTLDVLLNCLTVVFGGQSMGDWEEGMKNPEDGYKSFKI
ncbi:hypothetical protein Tco_1002561 [Tanacetum coccineum]|uniref:F-box protein n=1 Tax=Tanacetum coccineum TaxID=301880 RepID=A0ABQ5F826_9ASTR